MPPSKSDPRRKPRPVGRGGQRFGQAAAKATGLSDAIASFARSGVGKALLGDSSPRQRKLKGKTYELIPMETGVSGIVGAAARTAGRAAAASGGRSGGKIAASVSADASKAAARRTRQESAAIAKGTARSRTKEGAEALERAEARAASRKSVFDAPKSGVTARAGKETGEMSGRKTLVEEMKTFGKKRSDSLKSEKGKGARTAKQQERVTADLQESMRRGRRLRERGMRDSDDYGPRDVPSAPVRPAPTAPKAALRETASAGRAQKLTKPKNPGRNGTANQQAKYKQEMAAWEKQQAKMASKERDISEGRRSTETGELRGPSAKSARRQQEKLAKSKAKREDAPATPKPEVKKPSAKKVDTPKADAPKAKVTPSAPAAKPASTSAADRAAEIKAAVKKPSATGGSGGKGGGSGKGTGGSGSGAGKPSGSPKPSADRASEIRDAAKATGLKVKTPNSPNPNKYSPAFTPNKTKPNAPITGSARAEEIRKAALASKAIRESDAASASKAKAGLSFNKKQKTVIGGAAAAGGAAAFQKKLDRDVKSDKTTTSADPKPVSNKTASPTVRDKFGRKISRAEFDRREAFRKANNLDSMTPAERAKWRKENKDKWRAEESRRGKYRKNLGRKAFGKEAVTKTRNVKKRKTFDTDTKKSLKG